MSDAIAETILRLCRARGASKTICPSEVARALLGDDGPWRDGMADVRVVAARLVREGKIRATQKGEPVDPVQIRGPIRLGLAQPADDNAGQLRSDLPALRHRSEQ
ncbi:MAG: DUF3253 domain-containing protein [Pseudomonadota bacterium]